MGAVWRGLGHYDPDSRGHTWKGAFFPETNWFGGLKQGQNQTSELSGRWSDMLKNGQELFEFLALNRRGFGDAFPALR